MPKLFFNLHGVPEDEIHDVRELCKTLELSVYETDKGRWGIGLAAIWLSDENQFPAAKEALNEYQHARYQGAQEDRNKMQELSFAQGLYVKFKQDPNLFALTFISLAVVVGVTLYPFLSL